MASRKSINLALQGGGAHGAFTWGVLDRILEDERIEIEGISGTSAGAMNAVVLADGFARGGSAGARERLSHFWHRVSEYAVLSPLQRTAWDRFFGNWSMEHSPGFAMLDLMQRLASPYDLNPCNINPLRDLLIDTVCFDRVRACVDLKIFVSATNVHTGRVKVFNRDDLTADMVMASACLPFMFHAVEIEGVPYWDGGYMGNPVLFPFFEECHTNDIVVVQINPVERPGLPTTPREILNRVNEITFNSSLLREYRAINFVGRLLDAGALDSTRYKKVLMHRIHDDARMSELGASSKMNAEYAFFEHLRDLGRAAADRWLESSFDSIGVASTFDTREFFAGHEADYMSGMAGYD